MVYLITHIVRPNDNIFLIEDHYRVSIDEIISANRQIRDFNNLIPGTKIKIPQIPEEIEEELEKTEPFIEQYYDEETKKEIEEERKNVKKPIKFPLYYKKYNK